MAGRRHQGLGAAVMRIGDNNLGGGNGDAAQAKLANRACDERSREALADSRNSVERAGCQLMKQRRSAEEPIQFLQDLLTGFRDIGAPLRVAYQSFESRLMLRPKLVHKFRKEFLLACLGAMSGLD
jgi:hypothetical protein